MTRTPAVGLKSGLAMMEAEAPSRLMITKMVLENFKSYGGVREVPNRNGPTGRESVSSRSRSRTRRLDERAWF